MISIPVDWITYINIGLVVFYIAMMVIGASKGFLRQVVSLIGVCLSLFAAWRYYDVAAAYLRLWPKEWTPLQNTLLKESVYAFANQAMWFVIIFAVCRIILLILESLLKEIESTPVIREVSGLLGGAIGIISATVWVMVLFTVLHTPFFSNGVNISNNTWISLIHNTVVSTADNAGITLDTSDMIDKIYSEAKSLDDADREAVAEWLEAQGFDKLGEEQQ